MLGWFFDTFVRNNLNIQGELEQQFFASNVLQCPSYSSNLFCVYVGYAENYIINVGWSLFWSISISFSRSEHLQLFLNFILHSRSMAPWMLCRLGLQFVIWIGSHFKEQQRYLLYLPEKPLLMQLTISLTVGGKLNMLMSMVLRKESFKLRESRIVILTNVSKIDKFSM